MLFEKTRSGMNAKEKRVLLKEKKKGTNVGGCRGYRDSKKAQGRGGRGMKKSLPF